MPRTTWLLSQGAGLAVDGMQVALVKGRPRILPWGFSWGFYKSASKTAAFMLRCHIQGPTQDQLLADFDSLSQSLGQSCPKLGHQQGLVFDAFHSALLSLLWPHSWSPYNLFHIQGFTYDSFILGTLTKEICSLSKRTSCNLVVLLKGGGSSIDQLLWMVMWGVEINSHRMFCLALYFFKKSRICHHHFNIRRHKNSDLGLPLKYQDIWQCSLRPTASWGWVNVALFGQGWQPLVTTVLIWLAVSGFHYLSASQSLCFQL